MEPVTIFAVAVAFIGVFHLMSTAVNKFSRGRNINTARAKGNRSDWYCFFSMSDLTGSDGAPVKKRDQQSFDELSEELVKQKRQQQAQRPRLQAN